MFWICDCILIEMEIFMKRILSVLLSAALLLGTNTVFGEGFENTGDNKYIGFTINNEITHTGTASLQMTSDTASYTVTAPEESSICTAWFFDNITNKTINTNALCKAGDGILGVNGNISADYYVAKISEDDAWIITEIPRSGGWHQFVFDYSGTGAKMYIDGNLVKNFKSSNKISGLKFYDQISDGNISGMCIDDVEFPQSMEEIELGGSGAASSKTDFDFDMIMCGAVILKTDSEIAFVKNYKEVIDQAPFIKDDRTFVPVRFLAEGFGSEIQWDDFSKSAKIIYADKEIIMTADKNEIWVNEEKTVFDTAPFIENGRLMVPVKAFCDAVGMNVYWEQSGIVAATQSEIKIDDNNIINQIVNLYNGLEKSTVMKSFYVSPNGNDEADGDKDTPFKTINRAKEEVKSIKERGMTGDIEVIINDGVYSESLTFTQEDSGLGHYKVIYKNAEGAEPVIYGGNLVSGWEKYNDTLYKTHIGGEEFHLLTENGELSTKARFPNEDYAYVTGNASNVKTSFYFDKNMGLPQIANKNDLEVYCWGGGGIAWASNTLDVVTLDNSTGYIEMNGNASYNMTVNSRFYIQGALELIDTPGEFYYDTKNGDLYYYPKNLPIEEQEIAIPNQHNFIEFVGESKDNPVRNIKITGIELNTVDRDYDGIYMKCARNIEIDSSKIKNVGGNAVSMDIHSYANRITNCEIGNVGIHGVLMSNGDDLTTTMYGKYNEVVNNEIYSFGRFTGHGCAVNIATGYNIIKNCIMHDGPRMGVSIGSSRPGTIIGQTVDGIVLDRENVRLATHSQNNLIMFNEIYDVMNDSQDGGAFYSWGGDYDNVVAYNHIHEVMTPFSEGHGIYLDDAADRFIVKKNIVDNMYREGFEGRTMSSLFAKGIEHTIENNFIVESPNNMYAVMTETMVGEPCYSQIWSRNLISNSGPYSYFNKAYALNRFKSTNYNFFYNPTGEYLVNLGGFKGTAAKDLYAWRNWFNGGIYDSYSIIDDDPGMYDEANRDYRLLYNSECYTLGITDIDEGSIGLKSSYPFPKEEELRKLYLDTADSRIYGSTIDLNIGDSIQIKPYARTVKSGFVVDAADAQLTIQDDSVAKIENGNIIKGLSKGMTKLTISYKGLNLEYNIIVGDDWKEGIIYSMPSASIKTGESISTNTYITTDLGQTKKYYIDRKYSSSDESIATVDEQGNITGVKSGRAEITVVFTQGEKKISATLEVNVLDTVLSSIKIKDDALLTVVIEKSDTLPVEFEAVFSDGTTETINPSEMTFAMGDEEIASVDEKGTITGYKLGKTTLSVSYTKDGVIKYADFEVRVREKALRANEFIWLSSCDASYGISQSDSMTTSLGDNDAGEWALFKDVDFGNGGYTTFTTEYALTNEYGGKVVQYRLDSLDGPVIAEIKVTASGSWSEYLEQSVSVSNAELLTGVHDVYMCNTQDATGTCKGFVFK